MKTLQSILESFTKTLSNNIVKKEGFKNQEEFLQLYKQDDDLFLFI